LASGNGYLEFTATGPIGSRIVGLSHGDTDQGFEDVDFGILLANTGSVNYLRPNVVGDWKLANPTPQAWFNKGAFAAPAQFTFGNAGRNVLRGDNVQRFDISVFRNFRIKEKATFEFRAEGYNVFNTVTYGDPTAEFTNVNFGRVLSAAAARSLRLGGKIVF
jgi:hypothetical protein